MEDQEAEQRTLQRDLDWLARDGIEKTRDLEEAQAKEQRLRAELEAAQQKAPHDRAQHQRIIEELNQSILSLPRTRHHLPSRARNSWSAL